MVESTIHLEQFDEKPGDGRSHGGCAGCGKGDDGSRCGNGLEKVYPTTAVRFGYMRYIGEFTHASDLKFTCGAKVVIQTQRGLEIGEQVSLTCGGCDKSVTRDQMKEWVKRSGEDTYMFNAGRILREATAADLAEYSHIQNDVREKRDFARSIAIRRNLPLKVIECECLFGGERIIFFFSSEERVDFRAMVKDLAQEYRTRIEMRQIGARDEARLLADYETCGREVCCKVFLKTLKPISMRMAKVQKATLDPTQVSGRCGRLKCCLRYEHTGYEELDKRLPRVGTRINTNHGEGVVVNRQILTQLVQIRQDDDTLVTVVVEDILEPGVKPAPRPDAKKQGKGIRRQAGQSKTSASGGRRSNRESGQPLRGQSETTKEDDESSPQGRRESLPKDTAGASEDQPRTQEEAKTDQPRRRRRRRRRRRGGGGGSTGGEPDGNAD